MLNSPAFSPSSSSVHSTSSQAPSSPTPTDSQVVEMVEAFFGPIEKWLAVMFGIVGHSPEESTELAQTMLETMILKGIRNLLAIQMGKNKPSLLVTQANWQTILSQLSQTVTYKEIMESFAFSAYLVMKEYNSSVVPSLEPAQQQALKNHYQELQQLLT
jgi:hypothetical protein